MNQESALIRQRMRTPRSAAIAGILFSLLFTSSLLLIWVSIPANPLGPASAVINHMKTLSFSLDLLPFAGIAFLWFIAVVRDRLGELEDRFFATVFLGSGLLFLAMLFASAAVAGGIIIAYAARPEGLLDSATFTFARAVTYETMNLYAVKMAAVFMISTSTLTIRTGFTPRWIAFLGFACALLLLFSGRYIDWILLVFPLWVLLISIYILIDNLRRPSQTAATNP